MAVMNKFFLILLMLLLRSTLDKKQIRAKYRCVEIFKYVKLKGNSICWLNLKTSDYLTKNTFSRISEWIELRFELIPSWVAPYIQKSSKRRPAVTPTERLCIALCYLVTGVAQFTIASSYMLLQS